MKRNANREPEFITGRELARRLGVSETAVRKAVETGRIRPAHVSDTGRRLFIEATARTEWGRNTLPHKSTGRHTVPVPAGVTRSDPEPQMDTPGSRRAKDAVQTKILTVQLKKLERELVDAEEIARLWESHVGDAKRLFLTLPAELKMLIPALTTDNIALIENRIITILDTLSAWNPEEGA